MMMIGARKKRMLAGRMTITNISGRTIYKGGRCETELMKKCNSGVAKASRDTSNGNGAKGSNITEIFSSPIPTVDAIGRATVLLYEFPQEAISKLGSSV